ncbi:MAG: RAMP superfamily CRISPR-associated protein [Microcoleaceae cyanobacterium]
MKAITFLLTTKEPVLATSFSGDPNSDVSYPYLPGSMIRGALIGRYLKREGLQNTDILTNETVRRLFFDGTTRYLNAYPNSRRNLRTFPMLLSWRKEKGEELKDESDSIEIYDFSVDKPELNSPKSVGENFWVEEGGYVILYSVSRRINIHNSRHRGKGRSVPDKINHQTGQVIEKGEGEIFTYDAIDSNQTFQGVILCEDNDEETILNLINQSKIIRLGGSISAGYGQTEITQVISNSDWHEIGIAPEERTNNILKITLLSDLIFRDNWGQYVAMPPTNLLAEILGKESEELESSLNQNKTYMNSTLIGGFNRKWGLPLPQVPAVAAGNVFVYENVEVSPEKIQELERAGIGERIVEGFGRIAINWHLDKSSFSAILPEKKDSQDKQPELKTQESEDLAKKIAERILRQRLDKLLLSQVEYNKLSPNKMTNSQLSRLMLVARQALDMNNRQPLDLLLEKLPKKALSQYESTKLDTKIKDWLDNPKKWIEVYLEPVTIANQTINLTDELALEYTLKLIMAIAKNAMKEKDKENE